MDASGTRVGAQVLICWTHSRMKSFTDADCRNAEIQFLPRGVTVRPFERGGVGDDRAQALPREQLLEQQELGVEVLACWCQVDDGNGLQRSHRPWPRCRARLSGQVGKPRLMAKHVDDALLYGPVAVPGHAVCPHVLGRFAG